MASRAFATAADGVSSSAGPGKTTKQVYRDCLRLIQHMAGDSPKAQVLKQIVRSQFKQNMHETNEAVAQQLRGRAERVLSQYLFYEQSTRDPRFKEHLQQQAEQHMLNQNPELAENEALYEQEKRRIKQDMGSLGSINKENIGQFLEKEYEAISGLSDEEIRKLEEEGVLEEEEANVDDDHDIGKFLGDGDIASHSERDDSKENRH